ncbi:MAG TPA: type II toxin-antitoxin system VapC family toxin [Candidatus Nanoarchaeia archaeon]|nr:type II toxin-antitoxin system VapC family toxin [Candidatus Nanoarchaeia archaeon]
MNFLVDTSILIELENNNEAVIKELEQLRKDTPQASLYISIFTYSEYYSGVINKSEKNKTKLMERLGEYPLLNTTRKTAFLFSELLHLLKKKGKMVPHFDLFIAALAIENDLVLITGDNHFKEIPELKSIILT